MDDLRVKNLREACAQHPEMRRVFRGLRRRSTHVDVVTELYATRESEELDFQNSMTTIDILQSICPYLSYSSSRLVSLVLGDNAIGPEGSKCIGEALLFNGSLQYLHLGNCQVTGSPYRPNFTGIQALAKGFQSSRSKLVYIDLSNNALLPEGTRLVATALSFHQHLQAIDLSRNNFMYCNDVQGIMSICHILRYNRNAISLNLSRNVINRKGIECLEDVMKENTTCTSLDLSNCSLHRIRHKKIHIPSPTLACLRVDDDEDNNTSRP